MSDKPTTWPAPLQGGAKRPSKGDLNERLAALKGAVTFSKCPEPVLMLLAEKSRMEFVEANVTLQAIGHVMKSIHVLVSGATQTGATDRQGRRVSLKLHSPGEAHGLFLWASQERTLRHDMVTLEPSQFLVIPLEVLDKAFAADPGLWKALAVNASRRLLMALEIAMAFGLEAPRVRFARSILTQLKSAEDGADVSTPQASMSQQVMAELLGVTRQTVTALVRDFQAKGYIRWRYGRITVLDLNALQQVAKFTWENGT